MSHDWFIDLRAHAHGGPVGTLKITDGQGGIYNEADLMQEAAGRDVLFMAHGYNVNRPNGILSLNIFKAGLSAPAPFFIGVLWPGDCILPIFIDYVWEGGEANTSGDMLGKFIAANFAAAASISLASHSLGARVILRALSALGTGLTVRQLVLLAGAIEDDCLTNDFNEAAGIVEHISVVASLEDDVLKLAYPPGNLLGSVVDHDHPNVKAALGRLGPLTSRPNLWSTARLPVSWNYGHLDYLSHSKLIGEFPPPVDSDPGSILPYPVTTPLNMQGGAWKPCWSAGFLSTRWHKS